MKADHLIRNKYVTQVTELGNVEFRILNRKRSLLVVVSPEDAARLAEELLEACERIAYSRVRTGEIAQAMRELDS